MTQSNTATPFELHRLRRGAVRPLGWMLAQAGQDLEHGFAGAMDVLSPRVANDVFTHRLTEEKDAWAWWDGESRGHWLWGYLMLAHASGLPAHIQRANSLALALRATQSADGYIGMYPPTLRDRDGSQEHGELWTQSRALLTLLAHHELTGDAESLSAVQRAVERTLRVYSAARPAFGRAPVADDRTGITHGLCFIDVLTTLHAITGDARYLERGRRMLADFDAWSVPFPNDDLALANLADPVRPLRGHAVHTAEHLRIVALGGPERTRAALRKIRASTTPSGALIGDESLHGPPHPQAAYEYCTIVELASSLAQLAVRQADAGLAEWLERLVFNAGQGARAADGRGLAYLALDTRLEASASRPDGYSLLHRHHGRFKLSPTHDDVACCCNPNALRLLPHYLETAWVRRQDASGLVALVYGPNALTTEIGGAGVRIESHTDYPFGDEIRFVVAVDRPATFTITLRKPAWATAIDLRGVPCTDHGEWLVIDRHWSGLADFTLRFEAIVRAEPYATGEHALLRGPLQYARPIAHRETQLAVPQRPHWPDVECWPVARASELAAIGIDPARVASDWRFMREQVVTDPLPWRTPPVRLEHGTSVLLPLGCTTLRRADFIAEPQCTEGRDA